MRFEPNLFAFLFCVLLTDYANGDSKQPPARNFIQSAKSLFWTADASDETSVFERVKAEKWKINEQIKNIVHKQRNEILTEDDPDNYPDDYELFNHFLRQMENTDDDLLKRGLVDRLIEIIKNKYEGKKFWKLKKK